MRYLLTTTFFIASILLSTSTPADTRKTPTIGFVLPLTGDLAFLGKGIRDGALLAQEDIRAKNRNVELLFEDNQGQVSTSATIGTHLVNVRRVNALISIISGVAKILKPIATRAGILNIGICSDTDVADGEYNFINYLTAEQGVSKFLMHLGRGKSIGIFSLRESGFQKITDLLRAQSPGVVTIKFQDDYERGISDFRTILTKRKNIATDAWLLLGLSPEIEKIVQQARALGIYTPVVSIEGFGLANDKSPFEGAWFIDSAVPSYQFRERFRKRFGYEVTPGVGHSYDSVMMLLNALNKTSGSEEISSQKHVLKNFQSIQDYRGETGLLSVKKSGVIWSEASVKIIKNGKAELLEHSD